jgi:tight adherence protein C
MLYLTALSAALAAALVAYVLSQAAPARVPRSLHDRMIDLGLKDSADQDRRIHRQERRRKLEQVITVVGERFKEREVNYGPLRERLIHAGYRNTSALALFLGVRAVLTAGLCFLALSLAAANEFGRALLTVAALWGAGAGWLTPGILVAIRAQKRQKEIQLALPDALDLLVICVEAGLGLNQALIRVAKEIHHVSTLLSEEIGVTNFQIRAGIPREEALKNLADRTGVPDLRTLVTTMIQTERFGTSIAQSLRVHADTLRLKRKQRAEEAAAKTTIKMVFPLALCVFPALFVVVLGPALIQIYATLSTLR